MVWHQVRRGLRQHGRRGRGRRRDGGAGEVCPLGSAYLPAFAAGVRAGIAELAPHLIGEDPAWLGLLNRRTPGAAISPRRPSPTSPTPRPPNSYVTLSAAEGAPVREDGRLAAPDRPGLEIAARREVLGRPLVETS